MQKILGYMRRAVQEYDLLQDGDHVAVGVSGGKDSLVLLKGLVSLKTFIGIDYKVTAITLDPRFNGIGGDYTAVSELCRELGVDYILKPTDIGEIVFNIRKEPNPCSLCARMRRGGLHSTAKEAGCNKIALGHHFDDAVETFFMNLFNEGRIGCFSPISYLSRRDLTLIRPLVFAPETVVASCARRNNLKIVKSICPADKNTNREKTKQFLAEMESNDRGFKQRIFGAMRRGDVARFGGKSFKDYADKLNGDKESTEK